MFGKDALQFIIDLRLFVTGTKCICGELEHMMFYAIRNTYEMIVSMMPYFLASSALMK